MGNDLMQIQIDVRSNIKNTTADLDKMGGSVVNNINTINRLESEMEQLNKELAKGRLTNSAYVKGMQQLNNELTVFQRRAAKAAEVERKFGQTAAGGGKSLNRFNMTLQQGGYQLQDFIVQIQSGTSFFTAFSQQGSQFASIFGPTGAVIGAIIALGSAIGAIAFSALSAKDALKELQDQVESLKDSFEGYSDAASLASMSNEEISEKFGVANDRIRSTLQLLEDLERKVAQQNLTSLMSDMTEMFSVAGAGYKGSAVGDFFDINSFFSIKAETRRNNRAAIAEFQQAQQEIANAQTDVEKSEGLQRLLTAATKLSELSGEITSEEKEFVKSIAQALLLQEQLTNSKSSQEQEAARLEKERLESQKLFYENILASTEAQKQQADAVKAIKDAVNDAKETQKDRMALAAMELKYGEDSKMFKEAQVDIEERIFREQLAQNKILGKNADEVVKLWKDARRLEEAVSDAKDEAKELEKTLKETAKAMAAIGNFGIDLEGKIAVAKSKLEALNKGQNAQIAGEIAALKVKNDLLLNDPSLSGEALEAASQQYNKNLELITTYEGLQTAIKAKEDALKDSTSSSKNATKAAEKLKEQISDLEDAADPFRKYNRELSDLDKLLAKNYISQKAYNKAVAGLNDELADVLPLVNDVSDAFGDFLDRGLSDFKQFAKDIGNSFKQLLINMAKQALQNKILIPIATGSAAGAGTAAAASAAGGAAASAAGGAAGSAAVGGTLGAIGTSVATGATAFGAGFSSTIGLGASTTGATAMALNPTMAAIGAAAPYVLAAIAVIGLFTKKVKLLDEGLRVTAKGADALVESFKTVRNERLFGLIKGKKRTEFEQVAGGPVVEAISSIQNSIVDMADTLGVSADVFKNFSYEFQLSLKGMTDEEKMNAITQELNNMGDAMAAVIPNISGMQELTAVLQQRASLERRILELEGDTQALRQLDLDATHEYNRGLLEQIHALEDAAVVAQERVSLETRLLQVQGDTTALRNLEINALDESNQALLRQIFALEDAKAIAQERTNLETRLLQVQGDTTALRNLEINALDESNQALLRQIFALEDAKAIADERTNLETRLLQLQEDTTALRDLEVNALDESNRALLRQIFALEDAKAITEERTNLETRLLQIQGDTTALRQRELDALDESNRALLEQIYAAEDAAKAIDEMNAALNALQENDFASLLNFQQAQASIRAGLPIANTPNAPAVQSTSNITTLTNPMSTAAGEIKQMREEMKEMHKETMFAYSKMTKNSKDTRDTLRNWDVTGLPAERTA